MSPAFPRFGAFNAVPELVALRRRLLRAREERQGKPEVETDWIGYIDFLAICLPA
jgi:hypothetical protein